MENEVARPDPGTSDPPPRIAQVAAVTRAPTPPTPTSPSASAAAHAPTSTASSTSRGAAGITEEPVDSLQVREGKEVAFYEAVVTAWIGTRMEFDKSLLTMSLAAIGVVITLLTSVGMPTKLVVGAFLVSTVAFAGVLLLCLAIFWFNATFLEDLASGGGSNGDRRTRLLDRCGMGLFAVGVASAIVAGGAAAIHKYNQQPASAAGAAPSPLAGRQSSDHLRPGPVPRSRAGGTNGTSQSRPTDAARRE